MTSLRLATLNLWNSDHLRIKRLHAAAEKAIRLDADVVALREVRSHLAHGGPALTTGRDGDHAVHRSCPASPSTDLLPR